MRVRAWLPVLIASVLLACASERAGVRARAGGDAGDVSGADGSRSVEDAPGRVDADTLVGQVVARPDRLLAVEGEARALAVLANDDAEGATLSLVTPPAHAEVSVVDGTLLVKGRPGYNGPDRLTYALSRGEERSEASVELDIYAAADAESGPRVVLPRWGLEPSQLAVVVARGDAQSEAVAATYMEARGLDESARIEVELPALEVGEPLAIEAFEPLREAVLAQLPDGTEALALTWTSPWRVGCMSMTSAFALGYDPGYCHTSGCGPTLPSPYYASPEPSPRDAYGLIPTMMLAGESVGEIEAMIARGVASDRTFPKGAPGVLIKTSDAARNVRWTSFLKTTYDWEDDPAGFSWEYIDNAAGTAPEGDAVQGREGLAFYFTGLAQVPHLTTNSYLPGAVGDHLTSFGGQLIGGSQMSALRWLEAGTVASYGTVVEPCNYTAKFPDPRQLVRAYHAGATVLEAYWRSVLWPGEGVFVGEPLASPWARLFLRLEGAALTIETSHLVPGRTYVLEGADAEEGPYMIVGEPVSVAGPGLHTITVEPADRLVYRLVDPMVDRRVGDP